MIFNERRNMLKVLKTLWNFLLKNLAGNVHLAGLEIQNFLKVLKTLKKGHYTFAHIK